MSYTTPSTPSLFDAHCHLQDDRFSPGLDEVIARAHAAGVERLLCCATSPADWKSVLEITGKYSGVVAAIGIHPWYLDGRTAGWQEEMRRILRENPCAVGEVGLDHDIKPRHDNEQMGVFIDQLRLAREFHRPLSIHCRSAWESLVKALDGEGGLPDGGVIHSFAGHAEMVPVLARLGCSFSYSGSITRPGNKRGKTSLAAIPPHLLLVETDAPDILPHGVEGGVNEPGNLAGIVKAVASIRAMSYEEAARVTGENARRLYCRCDQG